jgi:hypothetical protein
LPSFSHAGGGPVYHHDPSTHLYQHYGPPTPPPRLRSKERTPPGPISTTWRLGPHLVADSVCSGQQPAAGGLGLHIRPLCFCPLFDGPPTPPWEASAYNHHPSCIDRDHFRIFAGSRCAWIPPERRYLDGSASARHVSSILASCIHLFSSPTRARNMMRLAFGLCWLCLIFLRAGTWLEMPSYVTFRGLLLPYTSLPPSYPHCLTSLRPSLCLMRHSPALLGTIL